MSLSDEYKRQFGWRDWPGIFKELPKLQGQTVLDLGCGIGDLAAELAARGAAVIGVDMNEELLCVARARNLPNVEFRAGDLRAWPEGENAVDGIWCSFAAAYLPDLASALSAWSRKLKPDGWIALTEIDDLFGHEPLSERTRSLLRANAEDALAAGRYDFHCGHKLQGYLERAGYAVEKTLTLEDQELSFTGPARPDVVEAWRARFNRMALLQKFCGEEFGRVQEEFLGCLQRAEHRSLAKVYCCIARVKRAQA